MPLKERKKLKLEENREKMCLKEPCRNCKKKCTEKISKYQRNYINELYRDMSSKDRKPFILNGITKFHIKRLTTSDESSSRKKYTISYWDMKHIMIVSFGI